MTIYNIDPEEDKATLVNFHDLTTLDEFEPFRFRGEKQHHWVTAKFKWHSANDKYRNSNDFIFVHNAVGVGVVITEKVKTILEPVLKDDAEYLPIEIDGEELPFYLLNVTHIVQDALDLEKSKFMIRPNGERGVLKNAVFNESVIPDDRAFVYPENMGMSLFRGELLKGICKKYNLTGLNFSY